MIKTWVKAVTVWEPLREAPQGVKEISEAALRRTWDLLDMEERERRFLVQLPTQEIEWMWVPLPGCHYMSTQKVEQFLGEISV